ncbi:MAG: phosphate ABC transporter permease PstA [Porticoccaceae bacterium]
MTEDQRLTEDQRQKAERVARGLKRRYRAEKRFRLYGLMAVSFGILSVVVLFTDIISKGSGAFRQTYIQLELHYDPEVIGVTDFGDPGAVALGDYNGVIRAALQQRFPELSTRNDRRELNRLISSGEGFDLRDRLVAHPELLGRSEVRWLVADDDIDTYFKSLRKRGDTFIGRVSGTLQTAIAHLQEHGDIELQLNINFFTKGDSREPEQAGIWGAVAGSFFTLLITLALSFPLGVGAAVYLEEFAPKNRWTDLIEVNINNLAAVPSIIFGLLGLAIFINFFEVPRSIPVIGGLVLTLMTLPTIIISSRAAIKAVPPSIREAAIGIGASPMQVVLHHVLPLAMPGMLTGAIIGMAQALGETAPLLMIGMVAFIVDIPSGPTSPATVLPVQIFLWADSPERAFVEKTSAAIMVLLAFLIFMNTAAVWLRKRLERRW